ncbi:uncharacterized protein LOC144859973 [Branchiostoma floridae x Branchiostoma japonicum]
MRQLPTAVDNLKRNQDDTSTTVDALKRDQDDIRQLSSTVDALKRDQDDIRQLSTTVDALKRNQDGISATVNALKRDQDDMRQLSTAVDALKRDLDKERNGRTALEQRLHEMSKMLHLCQEGDGSSYRGTVFVTKTGKTCQRWSMLIPHLHGFQATMYPSAGLKRNYCRNPDVSTGGSGVWCYTTDRKTRWERCDVPVCGTL